MIIYENDCCGCASPAYPCIGEACGRRRTPHYYCDECNEEVEELYFYDDSEICARCLETHEEGE